MYFTAPGLEQASTERMARHHAERFTAFERVADLCSGIGGDLIGLAAIAPTLAVDIDPEHSRMGVLNAAAYGIASQVDPVCADVRSVDLSRISAAFIDPARRSGERRFRSGES
jgi:predicted RNA methylase